MNFRGCVRNCDAIDSSRRSLLKPKPHGRYKSPTPRLKTDTTQLLEIFSGERRGPLNLIDYGGVIRLLVVQRSGEGRRSIRYDARKDSFDFIGGLITRLRCQNINLSMRHVSRKCLTQVYTNYLRCQDINTVRVEIHHTQSMCSPLVPRGTTIWFASLRVCDEFRLHRRLAPASDRSTTANPIGEFSKSGTAATWLDGFGREFWGVVCLPITIIQLSDLL